MVHGLFRASGIVMIYRFFITSSGRREVRGINSECLGHFWASSGGSVLESAEVLS